MALLATKDSTWQKIRDAITVADWPTVAGIDPVGTPGTERLESNMLSRTDVALPYINRAHDLGINAIDMRWRFSTSGATATMEIWGRRKESNPDEDAPMKRMCSIAITAGTQRDAVAGAAALYFAASIVVTSYFKESIYSDDVEAGSGMLTAVLDITGYSRIYFPITAISGGSLTCEWAAY